MTIPESAPQSSRAYHRGVNLSGLEWGWEDGVPGNFSEETFRYFAGQGLGLFRIPIAWQAIQPAPLGPLDAGYVQLLRENIGLARKHNAKIIIDVHDSCRFPLLVGDTLTACVVDNEYDGAVRIRTSDLVDLWLKLSGEFRDEATVYAYDLMNEPHDLGSANWKAISQSLVSAIRGNDDPKLIMVAGDEWSASNRWEERNGSTSWISDPADNFAYEAHCYFNTPPSGDYQSYEEELARNPGLGHIGRDRLLEFVDWCQRNHVRGFLGEYGVPALADERWLGLLDEFLDVLDAAGFDGTHWAAGDFWPEDYPLSVQPTDGFTVDRPQMQVLLRHLGAE